MIYLLLELHESGYKIQAGFTKRDKFRHLGGVWDAHTGYWLFADTQPAQLLAVPGVVASDDIVLRCKPVQAHTVKFGYGLDKYQQDGVGFLASAKRAILADFPGAGKSSQAIRTVSEVGAKRPLVITKKSLIHNWHHQISLWQAEDVPFTVTNYEQVVRRLNEYITAKHDVLIIDEGHYVKNRRSDRSKAIYKLAQTVPYVWILTGAPVLNKLDELWMLLHIINRRHFKSYWQFVEKYCELEYNRWSGSKTVVGMRSDMSGVLSEELAPVLLRRPREVISLPPITRETVYVNLEGKQRALYDKMLKEFYILLDGNVLHAPTVLAQLTRLRQLSCTPALIGGPDVSAKTGALLDLIEGLAGEHKILVFSAFAGYIKNLVSKLGKYGVVSITGDMSVAARHMAEIALNNNPHCRVLAGTYGAMGEGLNLQAADIVILTDKDWVPANIEQAEHRAHRRGQCKPVHSISLVAENTVDSYIDIALEKKQKIIQAVDIITLMRGSQNPSANTLGFSILTGKGGG